MEVIRKEIENIEMRIGWRQDDLDKAVAEFKENVANCDSYRIVTFLPSKIREIEEIRNQLQALYEQKEMLAYLLKQMEV